MAHLALTKLICRISSQRPWSQPPKLWSATFAYRSVTTVNNSNYYSWISNRNYKPLSGNRNGSSIQWFNQACWYQHSGFSEAWSIWKCSGSEVEVGAGVQLPVKKTALLLADEPPPRLNVCFSFLKLTGCFKWKWKPQKAILHPHRLLFFN